MAKTTTKSIAPAWGVRGGGGATGTGGGSEPTSGGGSKATLNLPSNAERASGSANYSFTFANLAASTTVQATRDIAGTYSQIGVRAPYTGSIIGLSYQANESKTAGSVYFSVYVNSAPSGASSSWSSSSTGGTASFLPGDKVFNAGDVIDIRATTSSFAPTTADVEVILYVSFQS